MWARPPEVNDLSGVDWQTGRAMVDQIRSDLEQIPAPQGWGTWGADGLIPHEAGLIAEQRLRLAGGLVATEVDRRARHELAEIDLQETAFLGGRTRRQEVERLTARGRLLTDRIQAALPVFVTLVDQPPDQMPTGDRELFRRVCDDEVERREVGRQARALVQGEDEYAKRRQQVLAHHAREVLAETRPMGPPPGQQLFEPIGLPEARDAAQHAAECFPTTWWHRSAAGPTLVVDGTDDRGQYSARVLLRETEDPDSPSRVVSLLAVDAKDTTMGQPRGYTTAVHELTHRMEHVSDGRLQAAEQTFLHRRTTDPATGVRQPLEHYLGTDDELVRPDGFADSYIGKDYGIEAGGNCEVLSCGVEAVMAGAFGGLRGEGLAHARDEDHRRFTLGCLAAL